MLLLSTAAIAFHWLSLGIRCSLGVGGGQWPWGVASAWASDESAWQGGGHAGQSPHLLQDSRLRGHDYLWSLYTLCQNFFHEDLETGSYVVTYS